MAEPLPVPDQAARERALDAGGSFIVQAPAGSGKTELLAQRYLKLLAQVEAPEEIVAITFTNKAAAEMRGRVVDALQRAQTPNPPTPPHQALTWRLARRVLHRDQVMDWQLTANPQRLRVQTIDALCAALTRQMPWMSGFGAQPVVTDRAEEIYQEAARRTMAELETGLRWSDAIQALLKHLDNDVGRVAGLLAQLLSRRDQWLRHLTDEVPRAELEAALGRIIRQALQRLRASLPAELAGELTLLARYAAGNLVADGRSGPLVACQDLRGLPEAVPARLPEWLGLAELLTTRTGGWRSRLTAELGFPAPGRAKDAAEKRRRTEMKQVHGALVLALRSDAFLAGRLHGLRGLPPVRYDPAQWRVLGALLEMLPMAAAQLEVVFRERGQVDFTQVSQAALRALGRSEQPTDLALRLDYRLRHLLVDEFQDTSSGQHQLLAALTAGWEPGDGRTLFVVGDPMQSIYRFREADVGLFIRCRSVGLGPVPLVPLRLTANFRSQAALVDWVNRTFGRLLPATDDMGAGAVAYAESRPLRADLDGPAVSFHPFLGRDPAAEASRVVELVCSARESSPEGTVAVLVRSRSHLTTIMPAMRRAGLPFQAMEIERLSDRQLVLDLVALTRALLHLGDRVAWLAVLRAPWCGLSLADLYALAGTDHHRTIYELMMDPLLTRGVSRDGRLRLGRVSEVLQQSLAERGRLSLRRSIEGTWLALGGPACLAAETDLRDASVFFDRLEELPVEAGLDEPAQLGERLHDLFALPDAAADGSLQIMTIHKAKGLEFDTVILPGLGLRPPASPRRLLMWLERTSRVASASELLLAPIKASDSEEDAIYRYIARLDREKGEYEDGRLLYVAATRARRRLHLLGHTPFRISDGRAELRPPESGSLLARLWPEVAGHFQTLTKTLASDRTAGDGGRPPPERSPVTDAAGRLPSDWAAPPVPPSAPWHGAQPPEAGVGAAEVEFQWARETIRHVGTVVHRLLGRLGQQGAVHSAASLIGHYRSECRAALLGLGVPPERLGEALGRAMGALQQTLDDPKGRWILDPGHMHARCEYALSGVIDGRLVHVVLDRCFVDERGVGWIIDYKTSAHEGADLEEFLDNEQARYRQQLRQYATLMQARDPRPWRLGLYFPLLAGWREWQYDA